MIYSQYWVECGQHNDYKMGSCSCRTFAAILTYLVKNLLSIYYSVEHDVFFMTFVILVFHVASSPHHLIIMPSKL